MVTCHTHPLLFILFLSFVIANSAEAEGGVKFQLIRRRDLLPRGVERLRQLVRSDTARVRGISRRVNVRRQIRENVYEPACNNGSRGKDQHASGELPMHSGADNGVGQYLVKLRVGSPSQKLVLIADTGSDLTWSNCRYKCPGGRCARQRRRVFRADLSSSFRTVPCSSTICKTDLANLFSLSSCPSPLDPCSYDYRYSDGSATVGVFGNESVTLRLSNGRKARLHDVLVGCSESARGQSFVAADGVMGLGYSNYSVAVKAAERFGGKFSYCLVDHLSPKNVSSYLIFGSHKDVNISVVRMRYTQLVLGVINPFYAVNVKGISVGGVMLDIPAEVWDLKGVGGAIVDSGTSLTVLTRPAYKPLMAALQRSLLDFKQLHLDIGPLDYCFNSTGFDAATVPRLGLHFVDGARFEPPVKSYVIDAAPGVKCLGFAEGAWPGASVVGNILQQNHFWEFDIGKSRLGFATSSCV
ncbi:aspartic proteinase NANA, chloroplast [Salvia miltiorrhiza]|uniref:aspartic proteinase NANA, chloroplast n=1 Tax=Salvia miltiorrhiza TaxID=226208 RepID=UPI0025ABB372|nr:aspartic proteinase NANA, chloroplast [Salvia miltiorrhiza]